MAFQADFSSISIMCLVVLRVWMFACVCLWKGVLRCPCWGQRRIAHVMPHYSLPYSRDRVSHWTWNHFEVGSAASTPMVCFIQSTGITHLWPHWCFFGSRDSNSGPHACIAKALTHQARSQYSWAGETCCADPSIELKRPFKLVPFLAEVRSAIRQMFSSLELWF